MTPSDFGFELNQEILRGAVTTATLDTVIAQLPRMSQLRHGGIAAVLAMTEVLILAPLSGDASKIRVLERGWSLDQADGCYLVPRQDSHFWFALTGEHASATMAKLCGVDLRLNRFADLAIAQTSVAGSNCVVIRGDLGELPAFHLLGDSPSAGYMWDCLLDAMAEFSGRPVGLAVLQRAEESGPVSGPS